MMTRCEQVRMLLQEAFPGADIHVGDRMGDDQHLHVRIVSETFRHQTRLQCHKRVYQALGDLVGGKVHALALETIVPSD